MKAGKIFIDDYRISFVFATEDPFVEDDLKIGLKKRGFNIEVGSRIINAPPFRAVRADIAKKGNVSVLYDNEVSFVGITGKSFKEVRDCFDALGETLSELDKITFGNQKDVELVLRAHVWTKKDPQKSIATFMKSLKLEPFRAIFGKNVRPFTLRIVTEDQNITDNPDWFELRIDPMIRNPRYYYVEMVYRNSEKLKVLGIADNIEKIVSQSIEVIEGKQ